MSINAPLGRKLRMGLVGGGGGFIGRVHGTAAQLDQRAELVAGALSSDPAKARSFAKDFGIAADRAYGSFAEMVAQESRLPENKRIDFVTIATPNDTHFAIAKTFIEAGFNVMCDKPMTMTVADARTLVELVKRSGVVFAVTHNYTGYPLVRQARDMIRAGRLGEINAIRAHYLQGSLYRQRTPEQQQRFAWKTDPKRAGMSGCFGDIGIHAFNLVRYVTGLVPESVSCELKTFYPGGRLDDYGTALLRFANGALGAITASRIAHGHENDLRIEIDGTLASLSWRQEEPNAMCLRVNGGPQELLTRDPLAPWTSPLARASSRLPSGHPEGFLQAFANLYAAAFEDMIARALGRYEPTTLKDYPTVFDGLKGVKFVAQCVRSSQQGGACETLQTDNHGTTSIVNS